MSDNLIDAINERMESFNWTPRDLVMELGTSGLAQRLAGTSDKKSKEYKSSLRNVNRYIAPAGKQQRKPSAATQQRMNQIAREQKMKPPPPKGGVGVNLDGKIIVGGSPDKARDREIDLDIAEEDWARLQDAAIDGDEAAAWDVLADAYGVDYMEMVDGEITID